MLYLEKRKIKKLLERWHVNFKNWGTTEKTRPLDDLVREVINKEITLEVSDGKVFKISTGAAILIKYQNDSKAWYLKEEKQIKKNGQELIRDLKMTIGVKKLRLGETAENGAYRVLKEELGINQKLVLNFISKKEKDPKESADYPGIYSVSTDYYFEVFLPEKLFKEEGYVRKNKGNTTHFKWRAIL